MTQQPRILRPMHHAVTSASLVLLTACLSAQQPAPDAQGETPDGRGVTHPAARLGRPVGVDFQLADWGEVSSYHALLAEERRDPEARDIMNHDA